MSVQSGRRLLTLDVLRAVACLTVIYHHGLARHYYEAWERQRPSVFWLASPFFQGWSAVHLFLLVSGFCIHYKVAVTGSQELPKFSKFWIRRLRRLYPPYLAAIVFTVVLLPLRSGLYHNIPIASPRGYALATFLHLTLMFPFWGQSLVLLGNPAFWTLALEEQLYLMYFILLRIRLKLGVPKTIGWVVVITLVSRAAAVSLSWGTASSPEHILLYVHPWDCPVSSLWLLLGPSRWVEWALGFVAVEAATNRIRLPEWCSSLLLAGVAYVAALVCQFSLVGVIFEDPLWGLFYFLWLNWLLKLESQGRLGSQWWWKRAAAIGTGTYSLYLVHLPILSLTQPWLVRHLSAIPGQVLGIFLVFPVAVFWFRHFEKPAISWSHQGSTDRRQDRAKDLC